jgi:hypothetical protein
MRLRLKAKKFHVEKAEQDLDLALVYRPEKGKKNRKAMYAEIEERDKTHK